ncbi:MAG: hypothetical protein OXE99_14380, partial [Cellvibrionales bacterium]|nr:hypothetical protein [Cellvibrionales bacterium]
NKVKLSLMFNEGFTPVLIKSEVDGKSYVSLTDETIKNTTAFLMIDDVHVPLKKPLSRIQLPSDSQYLINIQNDQPETQIKISNDKEIYEDFLSLSKNNSLESIDVSGRFDAVEQTLVSHHFSINMKATEKTPDVPVVEISTTEDERLNSLIKTATISFGAIAGGAALMYLAYTLKQTHEEAVKAIRDMPIAEMKDLISKTDKALDDVTKKANEFDVDSLNSLIKHSGDLVDGLKSGQYSIDSPLLNRQMRIHSNDTARGKK